MKWNELSSPVQYSYLEDTRETWGAGVETQENKKIFVPLPKKDKTKKSNERWT